MAQEYKLVEHYRGIRDAIKEQFSEQEKAAALGNDSVELPAIPTVQVPENGVARNSEITLPTHTPVVPTRPVNLRNLDLDADNPDSRQREHRILMAAARQLGRVPSISEAIGILDRSADYWNDKRRKRIAGTLRFVAKTFDVTKCKRCGDKPDLNLEKYTTFFMHRYHERKISPAKLSAFVSAVEWSLDHKDRGDGSVPRSRITNLSGLSNEMCKRLAQFVVREGIFDCDLSEYGHDQSRKWKIGNNFPGRESWRRNNKDKSLRSMLRIELRTGKFVVAPLRFAPATSPVLGLDPGHAFKSTDTSHTPYHNTLVWIRTPFLISEGLNHGQFRRGPAP